MPNKESKYLSFTTWLELSNAKLDAYKTKAGEESSKLDKEGGEKNIQKANKRFHGIVQATKKQFDNDAKAKND